MSRPGKETANRPVRVSGLYEHLRALNADVANITVAMHQITGDATPDWEDAVMSQAANNVVLNTLYRKFKGMRGAIRRLGDQTVHVYVKGGGTKDPDAPLTPPDDTPDNDN